MRYGADSAAASTAVHPQSQSSATPHSLMPLNPFKEGGNYATHADDLRSLCTDGRINRNECFRSGAGIPNEDERRQGLDQR
jgi:hypothetical protein